MSAVWLITGGVRSGKSSLAARLATGTGDAVTYVATAQAGDDEMAARIDRHRAERADGWHTIEQPLHLDAAISAAGSGCVVIDCLTLWVNNLIVQRHGSAPPPIDQRAAGEAAIIDELERALLAASRRDGVTIFVTNEVGAGIIPADALSRIYQDVLGRVNQRVAAEAQRVYLCVAGMSFDLKAIGAPPD